MLTEFRNRLATLEPERFDMSLRGGSIGALDDFRDPADRLNTDCGTAGCLAGWFCAFFAPGTPIMEVTRVAQSMLRLSGSQAHDLFYATGASKGVCSLERLRSVTLPQALETLDRLLETGEVRWN